MLSGDFYYTVLLPSVVLPLFVFVVNWAIRGRLGYSQNAAADFLLATIIFDGAVLCGTEVFEPWVRNPELKHHIAGWHMTMIILASVIWGCITRWGEPRLEQYYFALRTGRPIEFPGLSFALCWIGVSALIISQVSFFFLKSSFL